MNKVSTFGQRLVEGMKIRNIDAKKLEQLSNVNSSLIYRYAKDLTLPKNDKVQKLASALEVNQIWLLGYDVHPEIVSQDKLDLRSKIDQMLNKFSHNSLEKVYVFLNTFMSEEE